MLNNVRSTIKIIQKDDVEEFLRSQERKNNKKANKFKLDVIKEFQDKFGKRRKLHPPL